MSDKITVEEAEVIIFDCLRFISELPAEQLPTIKKLKWIGAIRKHLLESDLAHWMDRCHELEAKLAEVRRRTSDKEGM